ncbi:unnamed protein product [Microthlaspi erraticum]|uniref:Uncharacterized protein n=1 Tax=Microthlaspi erraticum TaxID=1685480 RepID=A0A6D2I2N0_9BRAS|nr:unnamed protein product [Microthlaspi erraticum]
MEEDLKKQGEAIEDNRRAIHFTKVSTKEMDNHLDEKITSLDNNLDGTTKSLNSITAVAHQAKREVAEVNPKGEAMLLDDAYIGGRAKTSEGTNPRFTHLSRQEEPRYSKKS